MLAPTILTGAIVLTGCAFYGLITHRHMIRLVICLNILDSAVLLVIVLLGYEPDAAAPIVRQADLQYVLGLPHALSLTAIVISACTTALMLGYAVRVHRLRGTVYVDRLTRWRG
ncbi:MAG: sodium:proton antiporter [Spirochaetaceae bacterium]|nr:MAG: sodium:proton antiporter [Spirochaetaceae bacterium]